MLHGQQLETQLNAANTDQVRTLIIGAGVAGASLAALQRRRGRHPVLIERAAENAPDGYMLGLLPLAGNLLRTVDRYQAYLDASCPVDAYQMGDGRGRIIRRFWMGDLFASSGDYRGIERGTLIDIISGEGDATFGTTVTSISQSADAATVAFSDSTVAEFDVVIVADGIHSETRSLVQPPRELSFFDSKWGGWVVWAPLGELSPDTYTEFWGPGRFVGFYPVRQRVGIFVGGPCTETVAGPAAFAQSFREAGNVGAQTEVALSALEADPDPYYWSFTDCRSERFAIGRVVLLGDAGAGFMPTAGVGAAMAMDSAAALDDELSRTGPEQVAFTLELYERRQRSRVLAAQRNSRLLARIMFTRSRVVLWIITRLIRLASLKSVLGGIQKVVERR